MSSNFTIIDLGGSGRTLIDIIISVHGQPSIILRKQARGHKKAVETLQSREGFYILHDEPDSLVFEVPVNLENLQSLSSELKGVLSTLS